MEPIINKIIEYIEDDELKERLTYDYCNEYDLILVKKPQNGEQLYEGNNNYTNYKKMNSCCVCMIYDVYLSSCHYCKCHVCKNHMEKCVFCSNKLCSDCTKWKSNKPICKQCRKQLRIITKNKQISID